MPGVVKTLLWTAVSLVGAGAIGVIALSRGETIDATWFIVAAIAVYAIGYRFYSSVSRGQSARARRHAPHPAERINDGRDFVPTNRWVVFGHHFAAIAGPGPLIGPTLAAQFGYLPGTLWILAGVVLGGAVQDFCILSCSPPAATAVARPDGAGRDRPGRRLRGAGRRVLHHGDPHRRARRSSSSTRSGSSPWGTFTVGATIPIAMVMGWYMRVAPPGTTSASATVARPRAAGAGARRRTLGGRAPDAGAVLHAHTRRSSHASIIVYGFARLGAAGLAAARAARLPLEHVREARHDRRPRARHRRHAARDRAAGGHPLRRRHRADLRRQGLSRSASSPSPAARSPAFTR